MSYQNKKLQKQIKIRKLNDSKNRQQTINFSAQLEDVFNSQSQQHLLTSNNLYDSKIMHSNDLYNTEQPQNSQRMDTEVYISSLNKKWKFIDKTQLFDSQSKISQKRLQTTLTNQSLLRSQSNDQSQVQNIKQQEFLNRQKKKNQIDKQNIDTYIYLKDTISTAFQKPEDQNQLYSAQSDKQQQQQSQQQSQQEKSVFEKQQKVNQLKQKGYQYNNIRPNSSLPFQQKNTKNSMQNSQQSQNNLKKMIFRPKTAVQDINNNVEFFDKMYRMQKGAVRNYLSGKKVDKFILENCHELNGPPRKVIQIVKDEVKKSRKVAPHMLKTKEDKKQEKLKEEDKEFQQRKEQKHYLENFMDKQVGYFETLKNLKESGNSNFLKEIKLHQKFYFDNYFDPDSTNPYQKYKFNTGQEKYQQQINDRTQKYNRLKEEIYSPTNLGDKVEIQQNYSNSKFGMEVIDEQEEKQKQIVQDNFLKNEDLKQQLLGYFVTDKDLKIEKRNMLVLEKYKEVQAQRKHKEDQLKKHVNIFTKGIQEEAQKSRSISPRINIEQKIKQAIESEHPQFRKRSFDSDHMENSNQSQKKVRQKVKNVFNKIRQQNNKQSKEQLLNIALKSEVKEMKEIILNNQNQQDIFTKTELNHQQQQFFKIIKDCEDLIHLETVLQKNSDWINLMDGMNLTPLHWAAKRGNMDVVQILIKYGSNPLALDSADRTPKQLAERQGHSHIFYYLQNQEQIKVREIYQHKSQQEIQENNENIDNKNITKNKTSFNSFKKQLKK